jgi:FkbM family methyltransferase
MGNNEAITKARELFSDSLSLRVFGARVKYARDGKPFGYEEMMEICGLDEPGKKRRRRLLAAICEPRRKKFIYGAGAGCYSVLANRGFLVQHGISWQGIIDNNVRGERYGLPIIEFEEFAKKHSDAIVLNSIGKPAGAAVCEQCRGAGIDCWNLFDLDLTWAQYFDLPKELGLIKEKEVFVQGGCYNGLTQKSYVNWFGESYEKMIAFEPDTAQFEVCKEQLKALRDIEIIHAGLADCCGTSRFDPHLQGNSFISESGDAEISVVALDEYMSGQRVTFIALDIEGAELAALRGAERIIRTQKPKLAVCAYHKPEDIWELPLLVTAYNPAYKLYLRHYHVLDMLETVLYAV